MKVNDENLQDFNTSDQKEVELVAATDLEKASVINVSKLNGVVQSLVIGSTRYE